MLNIVGRTSNLAAVIIIVMLTYSCNIIPKLDRYDPIDGELDGIPVSSPVKVVRDKHGIVHIDAENDEDLFFALGYSMAQDRLMLMDMFRRAGEGTLSEWLGNPVRAKNIDMVHIDILIRALQFSESAKAGVESLDPESKKLLEAYVRGINKYIDDGGDSIEFSKFVGVPPQKWTVEDCFVVSQLMGLAMCYSGILKEYYLERIRVELGEDARDFFIPVDSDDGVIITEDELLLSSAPRFAIPSAFEGVGSNNWVLSGKLTKTGLPLLCNDPHVPHSTAPTFWYHVHLKSDNYDVMGLMFSGLPCFGAATNGKVAWTLTNVGMDYTDFWREKVNPDNPDEYMYDGKWTPFEITPGQVNVRGKKPYVYNMRKTRHGVVVDEKLLGWKVVSAPGEVLTVKYAENDFNRFFRGYQAMCQADNYEEWKAGTADMSLGPFAWNHTYADDQGNIAYWTSGHIPVRKDNQGVKARSGWDPDQDWDGIVPFDENPHLVNPKKEYIVSANNRVQVPGYTHYINQGYASESRAYTITELIEKKDIHDVEDMKRIQYDVSVYSARKVVPIILEDLSGAKNKKLKLAAQILEEWKQEGYKATTDSRGTSIYENFKVNITNEVFADELKMNNMIGISTSGILEKSLSKIIADPDNKWFDNVDTANKTETRKDVIRASILKSVKYMMKNHGPNPKKWSWGKVSSLTLSPAFVSIPGVTKRASRGPYPLAGTSETVNAANHVSLGPLGFMGIVGPSSRIIIDFTEPKRILYNATGGMADNPDGGRYENIMDAWLNEEYFVMSMYPEEYREGKMGELILKP